MVNDPRGRVEASFSQTDLKELRALRHLLYISPIKSISKALWV